MPSETFLKLPNKKKEKILASIKKELGRTTFDKISINKIVQEAEIARGSFYQYFADKDDMLEYVLLSYRKKMLEYLTEVLKNNGGDIFDMFYKILEYSVISVQNSDEAKFHENLLSDIKVNTEFYLKFSKDDRKSEAVRTLLPYIDMARLDVSDENGLFDLLTILMAVCSSMITQAFLNVDECEKIKANYKRQLNMLKKGFERKKV